MRMHKNRKYVLSIGGFDPSGGAGVLADIKTFESHKLCGLAAITANTFQNDIEFTQVDWISVEKITAQIQLLSKRFDFDFVKIGLIQSMQALDTLVTLLVSKNPNVKIIWDPIIKASAGFEFHTRAEPTMLEPIFSKIYLLTPNIPEAIWLGHSSDAHENAKKITSFCQVYLKGGHALKEDKKNTGKDFLFIKEKMLTFRPKAKTVFQKHGSGCVLASAITAQLAKGENIQRACLKAKQYTETFLNSNKTLLGYHKI
ncbi:MAG: hydroxymethylpyrimidine/phosphomethylpyrimidine kinase [Bacteroidetes bacterium]|nr:hydroxymethylpyrimidine/phosphomethylpyrimidine kinase [Bacteroidota bacterium]